MVTGQAALLPLHSFLAQLDAWQSDPSDEHKQPLRRAFARIVAVYGARGAALVADAGTLAALALASGSLADEPEPRSRPGVLERGIDVAAPMRVTARLWIDDANHEGADRLAEAIELALTAVAAKQEAHVQRRQLEALDLALRGIAGIAAVEQVLQLIVDRVRDLVGARYAALGIVGPFGQIEQFIVSGISDELRTKLGPPPRGHGLLGLIIREDRALLIDDIAADPRRYGFPEHHPAMHSLLGVPVRSEGSTIGNLYLSDKLAAAAFNEADLRLVERFALHAGIAIENARLHEELGRLAIVEERQRISQDLHDSIIQSLYAISLSLEDLPDVMAEDPAEGAARADRAIDSIHGTIRDIRNFIMDLQPELLADAHLVDGIRTLAAEFEANTLIDLELGLGTDLDEPSQDVSAHVLAIVREALSNIARHSSASRASITLTRDGRAMRLSITDNGRGFDVTQARSSSHRGLTNLTARAAAIGATMTLDSGADMGTRLDVEMPLQAEDPSVK